MRVVLLLLLLGAIAHADDSKLGKEDVPLQPKANLRGKNKRYFSLDFLAVSDVC